MAAQCVGLSLLLISCLLAVTSSAPLIPATSLEVWHGNHVLNRVKSSTADFDDLAPLSGDIEDRTPLADDDNDEAFDVPKSYVDASVFRHVSHALTADAIKPKPSLFVKKPISNIKTLKKNHEMKKDVSVPSDKLEPPPVVGEKVSEVEVISEGAPTAREVFATEAESMTSPRDGERVVGEKVSEVEVISEGATTAREVFATEAESMTSSGDGELPRLSPPIWLHSSLAEAMSDPLRLPMIEPYDRYDRYSHSIARDSLW